MVTRVGKVSREVQRCHEGFRAVWRCLEAKRCLEGFRYVRKNPEVSRGVQWHLHLFRCQEKFICVSEKF